MKKIVFIIGILISTLGFSQQEFKLDIADALVMRGLEFSYESYLSTENAFGISILFNLAKQETDFRFNENTMITPYFRHYFTADGQWNFFGEGFIGINFGKKESVKGSDVFNIKYTDAALGIAVGTKYVSASGLIIDFYIGAGRNLVGTESPFLVPRAGANVGWRF
jgi:hypothetical protein